MKQEGGEGGGATDHHPLLLSVMTDYRLDDLGWYEFERLCQALLKAAYGTAIEAWGGSGDLGRDAYAAGL
jgi:hypothetical protein